MQFGGGGGGGGVLLGILGKSVPPDSPNPDPISDPKNVTPHSHFFKMLPNAYPFIFKSGLS